MKKKKLKKMILAIIEEAYNELTAMDIVGEVHFKSTKKRKRQLNALVQLIKRKCC